jgi:hypothetical protein
MVKIYRHLYPVCCGNIVLDALLASGGMPRARHAPVRHLK